MAFSGYLVKVGTYEIPLSYMRYESYQITYYTQDLDSYRDSDGVLHRNALQHKVGKLEFNTPIMSSSDFSTLMSSLKAQMSDPTEKKASVKFYVPEDDAYVTQDMYIPDVVTKIRNVDGASNTISYQETRIAFIGY